MVSLDYDDGEGQALINRDDPKGIASALRQAKRTRVSFEGEDVSKPSSLVIDTELIRYKWVSNGGNYPDWQKLVPSDFNTFAHFDTVEASKAVSSLKALSDGKSYPVDLTSLNINEIREYISKLSIPNPGGNQRDPLLVVLTQWLQQQPMKDDWAPVPRKVVDILPLYQVVEGKDPESTIFQMLNVAHRQLLKQTDTQKLLEEFGEQVDALLRLPLEAKIASLSGYITKYLPDITQAYVNPQFTVNAGLQSTPLTLVGVDGYKINLSGRGAGTRQQVTLAVFEWSSETIRPPEEGEVGNTILAFDEPDLHLDYQAQRRIYEAIESYIRKGVQVIVATHSINLINRVPIECIYHYSKPASVVKATIECLSPSADDADEVAFFIDRLGEAMGLDNATMFYERCFLAFEGLTEQIAIPILFGFYAKNSLYQKGIKLVNCYDAHGAIVFARFMHRNRRPVLFLVDEGTTLNKGTKRMLTKSALEKAAFSVSQQVHFVAPECFEYAFPDEVWVRVLNQNQPESKNDWTPEKVRVYRRGAKEFINAMFQILQDDSKPRIGGLLAKAVQSENEIPLGIRQCFDHAMQTANP